MQAGPPPSGGCSGLQGRMPKRSATVTLKEEEPVSGHLHAAHSPGRHAHTPRGATAQPRGILSLDVSGMWGILLGSD